MLIQKPLAQIKRNEPTADFVTFHPVLSLLSYLLKAPLVPAGTPVVNSLFRQRAAIENILRACIGLAPISHMALEQRVSQKCDFMICDIFGQCVSRVDH